MKQIDLVIRITDTKIPNQFRGGIEIVAEVILAVIFALVLYLFLIWAFNAPEEFLSLRRRKDLDDDFSPRVLRYIKSLSIFTMIAAPFVLGALLFKPDIFGITLMLFIFAVVIIGAVIMLKAERQS
ncbi:hypothetical protein [Sporosarcina sp. P17b]|uniref:hypothetical protein n=1 Tax=Sporosarcina sp. P17b TaxID=2048260 RepID=UPI000C16AD2A|nr:hypothetical protein [Sporosarcina sp. P17b]PIC73119.1 hypothetical protein CSV76_11145 [Sporosarcina sp. P17b]